MRKFAWKVAVWNTIGYAVSVGIPTIVDPRTQHHVSYGARTYSLGYWVFLLSGLVFGLTYLVSINNRSAIWKGRAALLVLVIPTWATLWNFLPEFPHANVLFTPIWFGVIVGLTVYVRNHRLKLDFVHDPEIDRLVRVERVRMEYDTWFRILVGVTATYGLGLIYIYLFLKEIVVVQTTCPMEQMTLVVVFAAAVLLNALLFCSGFASEMLAKIGAIKESLTHLR